MGEEDEEVDGAFCHLPEGALSAAAARGWAAALRSAGLETRADEGAGSGVGYR